MYYEYPINEEKIEKKHNALLELFYKDIAHLSDKTIRNHMSNVSFFLNNYLIYYQSADYEEVNNEIDMYFSDFFIRKCMWSTPATTKSTAASLKKFYKSMVDHGKFSKENYEELCSTIKDEMEYWQEECRAFNDGESSFFI